MATFPTYQSDKNINVQPVAPEQHQAAAAMKPFEQIQQTIGDIEQKWSNANDVMQYTKAKSDLGIKIAQIEQAAANDPNADNLETHLKALQELEKNASQGIDNNEVATKFGFEASHEATLAQFRVDADFKKKKMYQNDVKQDQAVTAAAMNFSNANTDAQKKQIEHDIMNLISTNSAAGLNTPERAMQLTKNFYFQTFKADLLKDHSTSVGDSPVYKNLGNYGLDLNEMAQANKMIESRVKENKEIQKQGWNDNVANIAMGIAKNQYPDESQVRDMVRKGQVPSDDAKVILDTIHSPAMVAAQTDDPEFAKMTEGIYKMGNKDDARNTIVKILEGGKTGKFSKEDLGILINSAMNQGKGLREDVKNAIETLGTNADQMNLNRASVFREFQKNMQEGADVATASNKALQATIAKEVLGASNLENPPNAVIAYTDSTRYLIKPVSGDTNTKYVYDEKSKSVIPNSNYKEKRASGSARPTNG